MNFKRIGIAFVATALLGQSQTDTSAKPSFEVATIKPSSPDARGVRFGLIDGSRWMVYNHTLRECVAYAYTLTVGLVSGGPPWITSDRYDMVALEPDGSRPTAGQNLVMFQKPAGRSVLSLKSIVRRNSCLSTTWLSGRAVRRSSRAHRVRKNMTLSIKDALVEWGSQATPSLWGNLWHSSGGFFWTALSSIKPV